MSSDTGANAGAGAGIGDDVAGLAVLGQVLEENSSCEPYNAPTRTPRVRRASALLPLAFPISCALI